MTLIVELRGYNPFHEIGQTVEQERTCKTCPSAFFKARGQAIKWAIKSAVALPLALLAACYELVFAGFNLIFAVNQKERFRYALQNLKDCGKLVFSSSTVLVATTVSILFPELLVAMARRITHFAHYVYFPWCSKNKIDPIPQGEEFAVKLLRLKHQDVETHCQNVLIDHVKREFLDSENNLYNVYYE